MLYRGVKAGRSFLYGEFAALRAWNLKKAPSGGFLPCKLRRTQGSQRPVNRGFCGTNWRKNPRARQAAGELLKTLVFGKFSCPDKKISFP
jgi:hypothetical protein